jgi:glycosyltransferase involved in cell wall biosynthesis
MASPTVTVVIPCYNQACFLPDAVAGVMGQTHADWELVIVDDGSADETATVARQLMDRNPGHEIRLVRQANAGLANARNVGISAARGRYILPLDADDTLDPSFLDVTTAFLDENPHIGIVYTDIRHFGAADEIWPCGEFSLDVEKDDNRIPYCALFRREVWASTGGYVTGIDAYADWHFWLKCLLLGWRGERIPQPLFLYRKRGASMLSEANLRREELTHRMRSLLPGFGANSSPLPKVLLITPCFRPMTGGCETIAENLGIHLLKHGYDVDVLTAHDPKRSSSRWRGMRIVEHSGLPTNQRRWSAYTRHCAKLIEQGGYHGIVMLADPENWVLWSLEKVTRSAASKVVVQLLINDDGYARWHANKPFVDRVATGLRAAGRVIVPSTHGPAARFCHNHRIDAAVVPNAAVICRPTGDFRREWSIPSSIPLFLLPANLWPVKNHLGLMAQLTRMSGEWRLVMVGYPSSSHCEYAARVRTAVETDSWFMLVEGLAARELAAAYAAADVVLLPSTGEVSPVVLLEAMAWKKPWIATPHCGAAAGNAGGLVLPVAQFPLALQALMQRPDLALKLGEVGFRHWEQQFCWGKVGEAWRAVVEGKSPSLPVEMPLDIAADNANVTREIHRTVIELATGHRVVDGPWSKAGGRPSVSFCVITNGLKPLILEATVGRLVAMKGSEDRIIVAGAVASDPRWTAVVLPEAAAAGKITLLRNAAARRSSGEVLVFLDDDILLEPGWMEAVARSLVSCDLVGTRLLNPDGTRHWDWTMKTGKEHRLLDYGTWHDAAYLTGGLIAMRRFVWETTPWNESLTFGQQEDVELSRRVMKAGFSIGFCASATAIHNDPHYIQFGNATVRMDLQSARDMTRWASRMYKVGERARARRLLDEVFNKFGRDWLALGRMAGICMKRGDPVYVMKALGGLNPSWTCRVSQ